MICPDCSFFICDRCKKRLPANMMYTYTGEQNYQDVCWICLDELQDEDERERLDMAFDAGRIRQCQEGFQAKKRC